LRGTGVSAGNEPVRLHVDTIGAGSPVVLLHGWALHSGLWGALPQRLARQHRVYAVDLPGHGYSPALDSGTIREVVRAVADAVADEPSPLTLVGWSLGGAVAMEWALADPERIARLVLVATSPRFVATDGWPNAMAAQTLARFGDELAVAYRLTLQRFLSLQLHESVAGRAALAQMRRHLFDRGEPAAETLHGALALLASVDLRDRASGIAQPTLIVAGERDTLAPPTAARWLAGVMPSAKLVTIDGCGPVPFVSHAAEFDAAIDAFLDAR
jgi:pimeloyl-[acyl-carrier protein] methyl ester esterase